jgi:hypothetical protein
MKKIKNLFDPNGTSILGRYFIRNSLTPGPDLASLSHCLKTPGVAFSAIVQGIHIKSRQGRLEPLNRELV